MSKDAQAPCQVLSHQLLLCLNYAPMDFAVRGGAMYLCLTLKIGIMKYSVLTYNIAGYEILHEIPQQCINEEIEKKIDPCIDCEYRKSMEEN